MGTQTGTRAARKSVYQRTGGRGGFASTYRRRGWLDWDLYEASVGGEGGARDAGRPPLRARIHRPNAHIGALRRGSQQRGHRNRKATRRNREGGGGWCLAQDWGPCMCWDGWARLLQPPTTARSKPCKEKWAPAGRHCFERAPSLGARCRAAACVCSGRRRCWRPLMGASTYVGGHGNGVNSYLGLTRGLPPAPTAALQCTVRGSGARHAQGRRI